MRRVYACQFCDIGDETTELSQMHRFFSQKMTAECQHISQGVYLMDCTRWLNATLRISHVYVMN